MKVLIAADDSGSIKEILCPRGTDTSVQSALQPISINTLCEESRVNRIQQFIIYRDYLVATRMKGLICFYDVKDNNALVKRFEKCANGEQDNFVALFESYGLVFACTESGLITIIDPENLEAERAGVNIPSPVSAFVAHPLQKGIFSCGGRENDVKVISLFENARNFKEVTKDLKVKILFQGKNVKNNELDLRVPIWISKIMFIDASVKRGNWKFITVTRYGQIRRYDTSHGRKPITDVKISEKPLLTLSPTSKPSEIVCSDTHTTTAKFDIEKGVLLGKFKGAVGSIQALHAFVEGDLLATGGLDRYLRVFDMKSREQVAKVYIGSQISHVQVLEDDDNGGEAQQPVKKPKRRNDVDDSEEEELWTKLSSNSNSKKQKSQ